jgi:hypothetical protein
MDPLQDIQRVKESIPEVGEDFPIVHDKLTTRLNPAPKKVTEPRQFFSFNLHPVGTIIYLYR